VIDRSKHIAFNPMKRSGILALLIVATGAAVLLFRHQTLLELKSEPDRFHSPPEPAIPPATVSTNTSADELSVAERNELLRLRGQVGVLRRELAQESSRSAASHTTEPGRAPAETDKIGFVKVKDIQSQWLAAAIQYAEANEGRLPTLTLGGHAVTRQLNEFDLVYSRPYTPEEQSRTIVLREKQSWNSNGHRRIYIFADGHAEIGDATGTNFVDGQTR
jgi:hypothetical protein